MLFFELPPEPPAIVSEPFYEITDDGAELQDVPALSASAYFASICGRRLREDEFDWINSWAFNGRAIVIMARNYNDLEAGFEAGIEQGRSLYVAIFCDGVDGRTLMQQVEQDILAYDRQSRAGRYLGRYSQWDLGTYRQLFEAINPIPNIFYVELNPRGFVEDDRLN